MCSSSLFDETTFYQAFTRDLLRCTSEIVIESPFITRERMQSLRPIFEDLISRGVKAFVITRDPKEHEDGYDLQAEEEIHNFEVMGVQVLLCIGNHHRKLAILDRSILWEGSLNILSQTYSREIMRRIDSTEASQEMFSFLKLERFIG